MVAGPNDKEAVGADRRLVYLDYTQAELDRAYTQTEWAPNSRDVLARQARQSAELRARMPPTTFQYGESAAETLDVFGAGCGEGRAIHVHVHGGGWRSLSKDDVSFAAPAFVDAGAIYVAVNFATIPAVRLPDMVAQVQRAMVWLYNHAAEFGGNPKRIHLSGHSSGGHLAAVLLTTDWRNRFDLPADVIKSGLLMSGIYDLEPVMLSVRRDYVTISKEEEILLSPLRHVEMLRAPVLVVYGNHESPEFKRQAAGFVDAASEAARSARLLSVGDLNHFEVLDALADPDGEVGRWALAAMGVSEARASR